MIIIIIITTIIVVVVVGSAGADEGRGAVAGAGCRRDSLARPQPRRQVVCGLVAVEARGFLFGVDAEQPAFLASSVKEVCICVCVCV